MRRNAGRFAPEYAIYYLFSLLNSRVIFLILNTFCKVQHEDKLSFLLGLTHIKQFVRVPLITPKNKHIKKEIIERTEQMLALEEKMLSDFVDFSGVLVQKLDDVQVDGNILVLSYDNRKIELQIKGDTILVATAIAEQFETPGFKLEKRQISLPELRNLQVIDLERQAQLKDYIDDLVFTLYFNVPLKKVSFEKSDEIHEACSTSKYYQLCSLS